MQFTWRRLVEISFALLTLTALGIVDDREKRYCIIDLSGGEYASCYPVSYVDSPQCGFWSDDFKTTKMVMTIAVVAVAARMRKKMSSSPKSSRVLTAKTSTLSPPMRNSRRYRKPTTLWLKNRNRSKIGNKLPFFAEWQFFVLPKKQDRRCWCGGFAIQNWGV